MDTNHKIQRNIFSGGVETDDDILVVPNDSYLEALNVRNGYGSKVGVIEAARGNKVCTHSFFDPMFAPYICIGAKEDKKTSSAIFFIYNGNGDHKIIQYFAKEDDDDCGRFCLIEKGLALGFEKDWIIHSVEIIDGELMYWTDAFADDLSIEGNPVRKINLIKACDDNKLFCYELHWQRAQIPINTPWKLTYTDAGVPSIFTFRVTPSLNDNEPLFAFDAFQQLIINENLEIEARFCGNKWIVCATKVGVTLNVFTAQNTFFVRDNHYPVLRAEFLPALKRPPKKAPIPRFVVDANVKENKVYGPTFQFRYRYIYDDGERSAFSPISYVPTNFKEDTDGLFPNTKEYNKIILRFDDDLLDDRDWRSYIKQIEIVVRYYQFDLFRSIEVVDVADLGRGTLEYDFLNTGISTVVPSDENAPTDSQALKNFDSLPRLSASMASISDTNSSQLLLLSGNLERYDVPTCINATISWVPAPFTPNFPNDQFSSLKGFKSGGAYSFLVVYEDDFGRQETLKLGRLPLDWAEVTAGIPKFPRILFDDANTPPPVWAKRYRIAVTRNENQATYAHLPFFEIEYWILTQQDSPSATLNVADATHIAFISTMDLLGGAPDGTDRYTLFKGLPTKEFIVPESGDRLQLIREFGHTFAINTGNIVSLNFDVAGYGYTNPSAGSTSRFYVYVENFDGFPDLANLGPGILPGEAWHVGEIYRPKLREDKIYYELDYCFDVINAGQSNRAHAVGPITLANRGDTYRYSEKFAHDFFGGGPYEFTLHSLERPRMYKDSENAGEDWGRAVIFDADAKETFSYGQIRVSEAYISDSQINGLSSFRGAEFVQVDRSFGIAKKLALVDKVLLVICEYKTQPYYIGRSQMMDFSDQTFVGRSQKLMNLADELQFDLGSSHPESVVIEEGRVYAWDVFQGAVWRYTTGSGQFKISSFGKRNFFHNEGRNRYQGPRKKDRAFGGFERKYGTYYLTFDFNFGEVIAVDRQGFSFNYIRQTHAFEEKNDEEKQANKWPGKMSFIPEYYVSLGQIFMSFQGGQPYVHDRGDVPFANFYGFQFPVQVEFVFNPEPMANKIPWNIRQVGEGLWEADRIVIPATEVMDAMESRIKAANWSEKEGDYWADFLRNFSDKRFGGLDPSVRQVTALFEGEVLRGKAIKIRMSLQNPGGGGILKSCDIQYSLSEPTQ